jgi:predicted nucleic acid-binding protein
MGLIEDVGRGPVAIDTVSFIYFFEERPHFLPILSPLFEAIDSGKLAAMTSAITLLEVLVIPYRVGNLALAERYEDILTRGRGLRVIALDSNQLRVCAQLRAIHRTLKTPDALQLTAAMTSGCSAIVSNDRALPSIGGMRVLRLSQYL